MKHIVAGLAALVCLLAGAAPALAAPADCDLNPWNGSWQPTWTEVYKGVKWVTACTKLAASGLSSNRIQVMHAVQVSLDSDTDFITTPHNAATSGCDTHGQTAAEFGCSFGAQIVINANFSWPCCYYEGSPIIPDFGLWGLSVSEGKEVSETALNRVPADGWLGAESLLIYKGTEGHGHYAEFQVMKAGDHVPEGVVAAISGSPQPPNLACTLGTDKRACFAQQVPFPGPLLLLDNYVNKACKDCDSEPVETVAARTAVGVSGDESYLYLVTVDGGENAGASFYDMAEWLRVLGAIRGMNLDGGGSTTMVMQDPAASQSYWIVNNPTHGGCTQRMVGNFLGIIAKHGEVAGKLPPVYCSTVPDGAKRTCTNPAKPAAPVRNPKEAGCSSQ